MIAERMIARLVLRCLLAVLAVGLVLVLLVDFLESAGRVLAADAPALDVVLFYAYKLPDLAVLLLPVALVTGTCVAFALLGRHLELRALAAAGVGPLRLAWPLLWVAAGCALAGLALGEWVVPPASNRFEALMSEHFGRIDSSWRFFRHHMWFQGDSGRLIRISAKSPDGRHLDHVIALSLDPQFHLTKRLDMQRVEYQGDGWRAFGVSERRFEDGRQVAYHSQAERRLAWTESPDRFRDLSGRPQQKTLAGLRQTIRLLRMRGLSAAEYRLAFHQRFVHPLLGLVLALGFLPWLAGPARQRSLAAALLEAMGLALVAFLLVAMGNSAVSGGLLAPWLGAWLPLVILAAASLPGWGRVWLRARAGPGR